MGSAMDHPSGNPKALLGEERLLMTGHILWVWLASDMTRILSVAVLFIGMMAGWTSSEVFRKKLAVPEGTGERGGWLRAGAREPAGT